MKRSIQEIVELVIFALIALLVLTGVLWLTGWLLGLLGSLFVWLAGILWLLLIWIIPAVLIIAAVYFLIRLLQRQSKKQGDKQGKEQSGKVSGKVGSEGAVRVVSADAPPAVSVNPANPTASQTAGSGAAEVHGDEVHGAAVVREVRTGPEPGLESAGDGDAPTESQGGADAQTATHGDDDPPPPADAPITTVQASGEPVEPYGSLGALADEKDAERLGDAVTSSGEPVLGAGLEPVAEADVETGTTPESAEPIVVFEPEPVETGINTGTEGDQDGDKAEASDEKAADADNGIRRGNAKRNRNKGKKS